MSPWHEFYMLVGATAGVLIGLIFVVISIGADHTMEGDEHRIRVFVTPVLTHFPALLFLALAMLAAVSDSGPSDPRLFLPSGIGGGLCRRRRHRRRGRRHRLGHPLGYGTPDQLDGDGRRSGTPESRVRPAQRSRPI
jgi:hypothetical protein